MYLHRHVFIGEGGSLTTNLSLVEDFNRAAHDLGRVGAPSFSHFLGDPRSAISPSPGQIPCQSPFEIALSRRRSVLLWQTAYMHDSLVSCLQLPAIWFTPSTELPARRGGCAEVLFMWLPCYSIAGVPWRYMRATRRATKEVLGVVKRLMLTSTSAWIGVNVLPCLII